MDTVTPQPARALPSTAGSKPPAGPARAAGSKPPAGSMRTAGSKPPAGAARTAGSKPPAGATRTAVGGSASAAVGTASSAGAAAGAAAGIREQARRPLVGRARELASLTDAVAAAGRGQATAIVIGGDAGVGKSRLVAELVETLADRGVRCLVGRCVNLPDGGVPYLPFVDAFRGLDDENWRRLEPHMRGGAERPISQIQLYDAVVEMLTHVAETSTACLVLEDIHWSDRPSRDLLRYVIGRMAGARLAVVLTYRSDDVDRRHALRPFLAELARMPAVRRMALDPLAGTDIAALVRGDGPIAGSIVADIVSRADGNAFFAEELAESARSRGAALAASPNLPDAEAPLRGAPDPLADFGSRARPGGRPSSVAAPASGALPDALADVLIARLEQLDPRTASVVGVAAVAGRRVGHEILAQVSGMPGPELDEALREAVSRHILVPDAQAVAYEFRHALMQEAAYAELLPGERARLHRDYARTLSAAMIEDPSAAAELAYHAESSHDLPLALHASIRAAEQARSVHAPSDEQRHLEHALAWWHAVADAEELAGKTEIDIYLWAAEAAGASGEAARAAALLETADRLGRQQAVDLEQRVLIRSKLAFARYHAGDDRAEDASTEAAAMAEDLPVGAVRALARSTHAVILFARDRPGVASMANLALDDAESIGAANLQAEALVTLARVAQQGGDSDEAATYFTRALDLARESGDIATELRTLFNLARSRYDVGDLVGARQWTAHSVERATATGMSDSEYAKVTRGMDFSIRYTSGDWDSATIADLERAPETVRASHAMFTAHVAVARGMPDAAALLESVRPVAVGEDVTDASVEVLAAIGTMDHLTWQGDRPAALSAFDRVAGIALDDWPTGYADRLWLDALAIAALADSAADVRRRGDEGGIEDLMSRGRAAADDAQEVAAFASHCSVPLGSEASAWLARVEAEYSRLGGALDDAVWRRALDAFGYGYRYEMARCRWRLAEVLLERSAAGGRAATGSRATGAGRTATGSAATGGRATTGAGRAATDAGRAGRATNGGQEAGGGRAEVGGRGSDSDVVISAEADAPSETDHAAADLDEATELLKAAHAEARRLRAKPLLLAVERLAQRAKIAGVGAPAPAASGLLTAREAEVLAALELGRTNKQIGAELFISEKTASVHVSNILSKLGAATRGEAVALARGRGLL